ncbi:MAG: protein translocase subunit SecD [Candidatus Nanopelagicales bacterium]
MAGKKAPRSAQAHVGRSLVVMALILVALAVWAFFPGQSHSPRLGLDLRGGTQVILVPRAVQEGQSITDQQLQQTVSIIRARVDGIGVAEAEVTVQGSGDNAAIVVAVPDVSQERLVELVGRTALLDFRPVWTLAAPGSTTPADDTSATPSDAASPSPSASGTSKASASPSASPSAAASSSASVSPTPAPSPSPSASGASSGTQIVQAPDNTPEFAAQVDALDCLLPENQSGGSPDDPDQWLGTCDKDGRAKYTLQPAFIRGTNVTGASAQLPQQGVGGWVVTLNFDSEGASALSKASQDLYSLPDCQPGGASPCNAFAIVLDGVVVSAPRFNEPILGGSAQIEGSFTAQEAQDLANILSYGALPVRLDVVEVTTVSPTLGNDQLRAGLIAGGLGLLLVVLFLLFYYRALGVVAALSLGVAGVMTYLLMIGLGNAIGFTLTLAGVAGAIVAIGITADSFIIYFERIRDELREGRTLRQATDAGWTRARRTILAADFVSLLGAVILYILSVGSVRGFAFTLGLTTLVDIVVAFLFTRPVVVLLGRTRWLQKGSWLTGLDPTRLGGKAVVDREPVSAAAKPGSSRNEGEEDA